MGGIREYNFIVNVTTPTLPTNTTPVDPSDFTDKEYVDGNSITFTVANNQSSAANVTGVSFTAPGTKAVRLMYFLHRQDATPQQADEMGFIWLRYRSVQADWDITTESYGDDAGVTFSVSAAGQLKYTSTNYTGGSYSGTLYVKWTNREEV